MTDQSLMGVQDVESFLKLAQNYIIVFNGWVHANLISLSAVDHICYKCSSAEEFERVRSWFEKKSVFIYQSIISDRRIAIIKLEKPLFTFLGNMQFLELSDQKPDGSQVSGFDHIEMYPTTVTLDQLAHDIVTKGIDLKKVVRPHHTTYDIEIFEGYKVRLEAEPLIEKIKMTEMT